MWAQKPGETCVEFGLCASNKKEELQKLPQDSANKDVSTSELGTATGDHVSMRKRMWMWKWNFNFCSCWSACPVCRRCPAQSAPCVCLSWRNWRPCCPQTWLRWLIFSLLLQAHISYFTSHRVDATILSLCLCRTLWWNSWKTSAVLYRRATKSDVMTLSPNTASR